MKSKTTSTSTHSDFWLDEFDFDSGSEFKDDGHASRTADMVRLNMARRAIANFVSILTGKTIPVLFNDGGKNMTDGQVVFLSADVSQNEDFDASVGVSLHEASHILLTDFRVVADLWQNIPRELYTLAEPHGFTKQEVAEYVKTILNIVEDRYIDNFVYRTAPGYRGYYLALYEKYFNNDRIGTMLKSTMYRSATVESYEARLINFTNPDTVLDALPDFQKIIELIDVHNINRLKTTQDRFDLSIEVCKIIYSNVNVKEQYDNKINQILNQSVSGSSESSGSVVYVTPAQEGDTGGQNIEDILGGQSTVVVVNSASDVSKKKANDENEKSGLSDTKRKGIERALQKQRDFVNNQFKKKKVTAVQNRLLSEIETAGVTIIPVGVGLDTTNQIVSTVDCIVVKNMTKELIFSEQFPCSLYDEHNKPSILNVNAVNDGLRLGSILGRKLMIRNELNTTKYMRKSAGRIDRRIMSELGFDNENVFYRNVTDQYKSAEIHISVDASSSMHGNPWRKTITAVTAICKAASMIRNLKVSVSLRCTCKDGRLPYIVMVYDSSKDHFSKVRNLFPYLSPCGSTPEGLCYEAIMDMLGEKSSDEDYYFLNFSDGEPCFSFFGQKGSFYYDSKIGSVHTRKQVNKIRERGYKVLSYFISQREGAMKNLVNAGPEFCFRTMYGADASFINVSSIVSIAKTMNKMFLDKKN